MFKQMKVALWLTALLVLAALAACQPQTQVVEVTRVVTETITEEGQEDEVTRVVTEMQEVVVTATPEAMAPMDAAYATAWRDVAFGGRVWGNRGQVMDFVPPVDVFQVAGGPGKEGRCGR